MKFKKENDSKYFVRFMTTTEEIMRRSTVAEFIQYLESNAELVEEEGSQKIYILRETASLKKEFIVEDGRVFLWVNMLINAELVDEKVERPQIKSIKFKRNGCGGWLVIGDTERFGKQEVLYEGVTFEECIKYIEENGCKYTLEDAMEKVRDIQIGCRMFHRIFKDNDGIWRGYSNKWGWEKLDIEGFTLTAPQIAKRTRQDNGITYHDTLKLGDACTW
ncbi:hypothetical protein [Eisenbergiella sp.]